MQEIPVPFLVQEDPLEEGTAPQYSCLENPHGQRRLVDYSPRGRKEVNTTEPLSTRYTCRKRHRLEEAPAHHPRQFIACISVETW